jgi:hypothetical protein
MGEGKPSVGMGSEKDKEKVKKPSKPIKPRRGWEGFCELCRLPGHINKYCWTYPEEDVSDKPCDICEGRHGASPCYFYPEMYNTYHEGQPPTELYLRRAEETSPVYIDEIVPRGEIYHKKMYPPGGYYPWKGRQYMGPQGLIKIPVPFLFGPRRAWRSFGDPKQVPVQKTAANTYPIPIPEKRNLWYFS